MLASVLALLLVPGRTAVVPTGEQNDSPRRREVLPNGAAYLVDSSMRNGQFCMTLTISADNVRDSETTHGLRHVWEHFLAQGPKRDVDAFLEVRGLGLSAITTRDATFVQIQGPSEQIAAAFEAMKRILGPLEIQVSDLEREKKIMAQEWALRSWRDSVSAAAWKTAFADFGLDPFGDLRAIQQFTVGDIESLHRRQMVGNGMACVVIGDVDRDITAARVTELLGSLPPGDERYADNEEEPISVPPTSTRIGFGRAAVVSGLGTPGTLATIAAAFAIRLQESSVSLVYTPTTRPGLVVLSCEDMAPFQRLAALDPSEQAALLPVAKRMLLQWIGQAENDPVIAGQIQGIIMVQGRAVNFQSMREQANGLSSDAFLAGWARLVGPESVRVGGTE
ncbi:MAG: insulinase family protein [Fimbriimonadaceae bacterium]|nr:insulinase family protein [Fimbriimonadaceae bacterium]